MRNITKKEAKLQGLKVEKLLAWIELEKKIELMKLEAKMLREESSVDTFMCLQNDKDIIIGKVIKLKNVISTRFNSTQFKSENPSLYEQYKNLTVSSIRKEKI